MASLCPCSVPYNGKCWARTYQEAIFESLVWLHLGLNPSHPDHWVTLYSLRKWPCLFFPIINRNISIASQCCISTFDPAKHAIPKWCTERKWHIPMASNRKRSRGRIWLMKWDKVKFPWYTHRLMYRREWPLNCMTVISAWWCSNMPFQRLSGWLSGRWTIIYLGQDRKWDSWGPEKLLIRCGRGSPAEGTLGAPD